MCDALNVQKGKKERERTNDKINVRLGKTPGNIIPVQAYTVKMLIHTEKYTRYVPSADDLHTRNKGYVIPGII